MHNMTFFLNSNINLVFYVLNYNNVLKFLEKITN